MSEGRMLVGYWKGNGRILIGVGGINVFCGKFALPGDYIILQLSNSISVEQAELALLVIALNGCPVYKGGDRLLISN